MFRKIREVLKTPSLRKLGRMQQGIIDRNPLLSSMPLDRAALKLLDTNPADLVAEHVQNGETVRSARLRVGADLKSWEVGVLSSVVADPVWHIKSAARALPGSESVSRKVSVPPRTQREARRRNAGPRKSGDPRGRKVKKPR